jgi:hypothetical protein
MTEALALQKAGAGQTPPRNKILNKILGSIGIVSASPMALCIVVLILFSRSHVSIRGPSRRLEDEAPARRLLQSIPASRRAGA